MPVVVAGPVDEFFLEGAEERLGSGVVPTHPGPTHGLADEPYRRVFALRRCDAACIRRVCGTTVMTAWLWAGGTIPAWTSTGSRSATTTIAVRCRAGPVSRAPQYVGEPSCRRCSWSRQPGSEVSSKVSVRSQPESAAGRTPRGGNDGC